jgi:hypothetical protein
MKVFFDNFHIGKLLILRMGLNNPWTSLLERATGLNGVWGYHNFNLKMMVFKYV